MPQSLKDKGGYTVLSSRIAYENQWTRIREDIIRRPDGKDGLYGVVERGQFAVICPLGKTKNNEPTLTLVNQYRYPVGEHLWEFPMGMWETRPDADPAELAAGELREETGLIAGQIHYAGPVYQGAGYSTQKGHVYLATDLTQGLAEREQTELDMRCETITLKTFEEMICRNEITCMVTLAAFGLLKTKKLI